MAKATNKKFHPFSNYIYLLIILVVAGLLVWYFLSWRNVNEEEKYMNSYLISTNTITLEIKDVKESTQVFQELPNEYFVFFGYTGNKDEYKLEKKLKTIIDDYGLHEIFYYVNVTDNLENDNLLNQLNDSFNTTDITNVPCLLYYKGGNIEKVLVDKDGMFNVNDFRSLLKEYEFEKKEAI